MEILNMSAALEYCDNDPELLHEILVSFRNIWPPTLEEIRAAITAGDARQLENRAHFLKGRARTIVAPAVAQAAYRLEEMGEKKQFADAAQAVQVLTEALQQLDAHLLENKLA